MNNNYQELYNNYHLVVPEYFNFGFDVIDQWATQPLQAMLWVSEDGQEVRQISYAQLRDRSNQVANALQKNGFKAGERVLIMLSRIPEWWELVIGMIKLGVVIIPATTQLTAKDIDYRIETAGISAVITDEENLAKFASLVPQSKQLTHAIVVGAVAPGWLTYETIVADMPNLIDRNSLVATRSSDPLLLYFTSGTTGYPKMVLHTHSSYPLGHKVTGECWLALKPGDLHWNLSDSGWAKAAWSSLFGPLNAGATLFVHNGKGKFSASHTLALLSQYGIESFCAPPTAYRLLVGEVLANYDLHKLRSAISAGEPLNPEIIDSWQQQTGLTIREGYGQTETCVLVANFPGMAIKPGSMGKPAPGFIVDIIGANGEPLAVHEEGDIGVKIVPTRPVGLFVEYAHDAVATTAAIRGDWYITGDRGFKDEDGYFWFIGRADDVIISAGYRIGPFEVESALIEHPDVVEAAVIGKPDRARGQIVKAYVILKSQVEASPALATALQEFVKQTTAPYKYPREIEFVAELPKTISGKIRRLALREMEEQVGLAPEE